MYVLYYSTLPHGSNGNLVKLPLMENQGEYAVFLTPQDGKFFPKLEKIMVDNIAKAKSGNPYPGWQAYVHDSRPEGYNDNSVVFQSDFFNK